MIRLPSNIIHMYMYVCMYLTDFTDFICCFYDCYIYSYNLNILLKLFLSLECKYCKFQFGIGISSVEVSKTKAAHFFSSLCLQQNIQHGNPFTCDFFLKSERIQCFPVSNGVCPAFLRRAYRNCSEGLEEMLLESLLIFSLFFVFA